MWLFISSLYFFSSKNKQNYDWILTIQEITTNEYRDSRIIDKKDPFLKLRIMFSEK